MPTTIRRVDYYYATVENQPGEGYELLGQLAQVGINLLAFTAVPMGPTRTQLALFPEDGARMAEAARKAGIGLDGPHRAVLVQDDDKLGALAGIHAKLNESNVHVYASSCVTDGRGSFGYILYIRPDDYERAVQALRV
jgi:hypothetical protein